MGNTQKGRSRSAECVTMRCRVLAALMGVAAASAAAQKEDPGVGRYNLRLGSQAFGACYQFTTNDVVVEQAQHLLRMGSDIVKFSLDARSPQKAYETLTACAQTHPVCRRLLEMPFRHYFAWTSAASHPGNYWRKGPSPEQDRQEYEEVRELTRYLLTRFSGTGKRFYLGNWEGDWLLLGTGHHGTNNPPPEAVIGMRAWLNARQRAVDDAKRETPHGDVDVFVYVEVNRVRDAMRGRPGSEVRVVNAVLPHVPELDYVSYSSYDAQALKQSELFKTLDYIESQLPTNKASVISGRRVFIGEYGFGGGKRAPDQQLDLTRAYLARVLKWGVPFALFWQVYNNEPGNFFCLVDASGMPTPCYDLHRRYLRDARLRVAEFRARTLRLPTDAEFAALAWPLLEPSAAGAPGGE